MVRAVVVDRSPKGNVAAMVREVPAEFVGAEGVAVDVEYSSLNFKDALALSGSPGVARILPLIPGIDVVGTVAAASHGFAAGERVLLNGAGCGETRHGGYATRALIDPASTIRIPATLTSAQAAAIGTAGFTAALSVIALADHGVRPDAGPVLVTGATGGVGSLAITLLATAGYEVTAATGRAGQYRDYLTGLGATAVIDRAELAEPGRPLQKARWAAVVDSLGSRTLANALAQTRWGGVVTACGLAQGSDLPTTVMPFILRGVSLIGINSVDAPRELRQRAWDDLAHQLDLGQLAAVTTTIATDEVVDAGRQLLNNARHGRTVVDLTRA